MVVPPYALICRVDPTALWWYPPSIKHCRQTSITIASRGGITNDEKALWWFHQAPSTVAKPNAIAICAGITRDVPPVGGSTLHCFLNHVGSCSCWCAKQSRPKSIALLLVHALADFYKGSAIFKTQFTQQP